MRSKLKPHILATLASLGLIGFVAFVAWCGGYNFDHRNKEVAGVVLITGFVVFILHFCILGLSQTDETLTEIKDRSTEPMPFPEDKERNEAIQQHKP